MNEQELLKKRICNLIDIYWGILNIDASAIEIEGYKNGAWFSKEFLFEDLIKPEFKDE
jgi:hypothetical protein